VPTVRRRHFFSLFVSQRRFPLSPQFTFFWVPLTRILLPRELLFLYPRTIYTADLYGVHIFCFVFLSLSASCRHIRPPFLSLFGPFPMELEILSRLSSFRTAAPYGLRCASPESTSDTPFPRYTLVPFLGSSDPSPICSVDFVRMPHVCTPIVSRHGLAGFLSPQS